MSAATVSSNGRRPSAAERQAAARDAYRASLADGAPLSGAALGRRFDMSERWGRDRVAEVQRPDTLDRDGSRPARQDAVQKSSAGEHAELATVDRPAVSGPAAPIPDIARAESAPAADEKTAEGRRDKAAGGGGSWLDSVVILVVAGVAAAASYGHMLEVALWAGEPVWIARAFPVTVDGLVLAALRRGRQGRWWLALGIAVSVAANMLSRYPDLAATAGPVVSAWPPLALFGTHRLLHAGRSRSME